MKQLCILLVLGIAIVANSQGSGQKDASKEPAAAVENSSHSAAKSTATLVFYRPKRFTGSGLTPSVYVDGEQVARLDNGRFFVLEVQPGIHKIESSMKHDPLQVDIKPGQLQFLEMVILAGNWRGGGRMIPTSSPDGNEAAKKLKPLDKKWVTSEKVSFQIPEAAPGN